MDHRLWVVTRQDANGDRYFLDPGGYLTTDFFVAMKFNAFWHANKVASKGDWQVMPARDAYDCTVIFDPRDKHIDWTPRLKDARSTGAVRPLFPAGNRRAYGGLSPSVFLGWLFPWRAASGREQGGAHDEENLWGDDPRIACGFAEGSRGRQIRTLRLGGSHAARAQ